MILYSLYLSDSPTSGEIESVTGCTFSKGKSGTYWSKYFPDITLIYHSFDVLTLIGETILSFAPILEPLGITLFDHEFRQNNEPVIFQDLDILIDPTLNVPFTIHDGKLVMTHCDDPLLFSIALSCAQSVALEVAEKKLDLMFGQSLLITQAFHSSSTRKRSEITHFIIKATGVRHSIMNEVHLLDKPEIIWENDGADHLYDRLKLYLELQERFKVIEYKLSILKDDVEMAMTLIGQKQNEYLEWIIIILIIFEGVLMLLEVLR